MFEHIRFPSSPGCRALASDGPRRKQSFRRTGARSCWWRLALAAGFMLLGAGGWQLGAAGILHAKAVLAQALLSDAWAGTVAGEGPQQPWPWADTAPVARLQVPELEIDQIVLAGASGRTLAFGPGHLDETVAPGELGHSVVSGHRDTHFSYLKDLSPGMDLRVQRSDGGWRDYQVRGAEIVDSRSARLTLAVDQPALTLVTCYPFDAVDTGGPLRYAVYAEEFIPPQP